MSNGEEPPKGARIVADAVADEMVQPGGVHVNVSQELIVTTEDKVRLCLNQRLQAMERRREWLVPAGILIPLILTLVTSSFRDLLLSKDVWQAIFIIAAAICLIWLVLRLWDLRKCPSVEDVVSELKKGTVAKSRG